MNHKVLIIDDDPEVGKILQEVFTRDFPCQTELALNAQRGLQLALEAAPTLIVLDLTLPDMSGIDLCRILRQRGVVVPILLLTSRSEEVDKILGLESGADDYIVKPFSPREFVARIKAVLRRVERLQAPCGDSLPSIIQIGDLKIEFDTRRVALAERVLEISRTEFEILWLLASHPGKTFVREELIECILGYDAGNYDHALTSHISRLRMKIEAKPEQPKYIQTVRGHGYRFVTREELQK